MTDRRFALILELSDDRVIAYRNFNLCPHCRNRGRQALLCRLAEGLPMISRSDGELFHLLLADRPVPYPNEIAAGPTRGISACYWYSHVRGSDRTRSAIVVLPCTETNCPAAFRLIETAADLLARELSHCGELAEFYEFISAPLRLAEHLTCAGSRGPLHTTRTGSLNNRS